MVFVANLSSIPLGSLEEFDHIYTCALRLSVVYAKMDLIYDQKCDEAPFSWLNKPEQSILKVSCYPHH